MLVEHKCWCEHVFMIRVYPGEKATRIDPPMPPSCDPSDCPACGREVEVEDLIQYLEDKRQGDIDELADQRRDDLAERNRIAKENEE